MSVIINAFRLNREKLPGDPPPPTPASQPYPTAPTPPSEAARFRLTLPALVFALLLFTFVLLGMIFVRAVSRQNGLQVNAKTTPAATTAAGRNASAKTPKPARMTPTLAGSTGAAPATLSASTNGIATAAPAPAPLRLQAVFFDPKHPAAMIGGKTVVVGDQVEGYRVMAITVNSATLVAGSRTNVLTLY